MRGVVQAVGSIGAAVVVLTACSDAGDGQRAGPATSSSRPASEGTVAPAVSVGSGAGVEADDLARVLAQQVVPVPGRNLEDKVSLGVQSVTVQGKVMVLRVVVTPRFASKSDEEHLTLFAALGTATSAPDYWTAFTSRSTHPSATSARGSRVRPR